MSKKIKNVTQSQFPTSQSESHAFCPTDNLKTQISFNISEGETIKSLLKKITSVIQYQLQIHFPSANHSNQLMLWL